MKAKKSLGQNFLKSEAAKRKIAEAGEIKTGDTILEVGPGKGALTERLLKHGARVIAVEKDSGLVEFLKTKFEKEVASRALVLVEGDILEFDIADYAAGPYKIVANIPYNITGAILKKFLTSDNQPERMVLMLQHEVAQRIVARDGKESILSVSVKAYGEPRMLMKVPARYFSPAPKVDSTVIAIKNISRKFFEDNRLSEEKFWQIVKAGFAHKRKKLSSNLKTLLEDSPVLVEKLENKRAENLSLSDWLSLALYL
jgi:16S rRNA (adenine1518-N6/adenine1519-N6)-dimethyltransferase